MKKSTLGKSKLNYLQPVIKCKTQKQPEKEIHYEQKYKYKNDSRFLSEIMQAKRAEQHFQC